MAVVFTDETSVNLNSLKGRNFKEVYVRVTFGDKSTGYVSLAELCNRSGYSRFVEDMADPADELDKLIKNPNDVYKRLSSGKILPIISINAGLVFAHEQISTALATEADKKVYGLRQAIGYKEDSSANYHANSKVYVKLRGDNGFTLVDAKDVYVFANGTATILTNVTDTTILDAIKNGTTLDNVRMIVNNREVEILDKAKYLQTTVLRQETYSTETVDGKPVLVHQGLDDDAASIVEGGVVGRKFVDYQDHSGKDLRVVQTTKYSLNPGRNGDHIYVTDKQGNQHFVNINDLYSGSITSPTPIDLSVFGASSGTHNFYEYVGKSLILKSGDDYIELSPLTSEQATKVYSNTTYTPTEINEPQAIAQEGVYRKTKDGRYFEECKIQPICYDYADGDTDFTDYLFTVSFPTGDQTVIVSRKQFIDKARVEVELPVNGKTQSVYLSLTDSIRPRQLKRTNKPVNCCAVVQTTTKHNEIYNNATVLKTSNSIIAVETDKTKQIQTQFMQDYRDGKYQVNSTYNDSGELVEFSETSSRYVMTNYIETVDHNGENKYYRNFKPQELTFTNGKFKGAPTFDRKRANKSYTQGAKNFALTSLQLMFSPLGILTMVALPALPVVSLGAALSIPVARLVNRIRENNSKAGVNGSMMNPQQLNRIKTEQEVFENVREILKQTDMQYTEGLQTAVKEHGAGAKFNLTDAQIGAIKESLLLLEERLLANYEQENAPIVLHIVNGKAKVDAQNAHLAHRFEQMVAELDAEIKDIKKRLKTATGSEKVLLENELAEKMSAREAMLQEYTLNSEDLPENQLAKNNSLEYLALAKGIIVAKYCKNSLDTKTLEFINALNVDFKHRRLTYKHTLYTTVSDLVSKHPEIQPYIDQIFTLARSLDATEHLDANGKPLTLTDKVKEIPVKLEEELTDEHTTDKEHTTEDGVDKEHGDDKEHDVDEEHVVDPSDVAGDADDSMVQKLIEKFESAEKTQQELNSQLEAQAEFINQLLGKSELTDEDAKLLAEHIDQLTKKATDLKQQIDEANATASAITGSAEEIKAGIEGVTGNLKTFADNLDKCNKNIEKLQKLITGKMSVTQATEITEKITALQTIVVGYQEQISATLNQVVATLEKLGKDPQTDVSKYEEQIRKLRDEITDLKSKLTGVSIMNDLNATLVSNLEKQLAELRDEKKQLNGTIKSLSADKKDMQSTIDGLNTQISDIEAQIAEKQKLIDEQEGNIILHLEEIKRLKDELEQAQTKLARSEGKIAELTNQIASLKQKIQTLESENASLQEKHDALKQINEQLTDLNNKLSEENENQAQKIGELDSVISSLKTSIEKAEKELAEKQTALQEAEDKIKSQAGELGQKAAEIAEFRKALEERAVEIQDMKDKLAAVEAKRDELQRTYDNSREEWAKQKQEFESQIEALKKQLAEKDETIRKLQESENRCRMLASRLTGKNQSILDSADETINAIATLLAEHMVDDSVIKRIKDNIVAGKLYGLKTEIDGLKNSTTLTLSKIEKEIKMSATRIDSLETMISFASDEDDADLQAMIAKAKEKIKVLKEKQEQLKKLQPKIKKASDSFDDLKEYVDLAKVEQDINKTLQDTRFNTGLQPTEVDVKYLAMVILCFKNAVKQQKLIAKGLGGRVISFDTQTISNKLQTMMAQMQQFIRANYNVFNMCDSQKVKDQYYDKVSGYSKYDHKVLFTMPDDRKHDGRETPSADDNL